MSKFKSKLARRIMALILSGAMVMSNMSVSGIAYAAENATETVEADQSVEIEEPDEDAVTKDDAAPEDGDDYDADSGKTDTSQNEQTDSSKENNKATVGEASLVLKDLDISKNSGTGKWELTWSVEENIPDESGYGDVEYTVTVTPTDLAGTIT